MARRKSSKRVVKAFTIKGTNKVVLDRGIEVKVGDCVLMKPENAAANPYVASVKRITMDKRNNLKVKVKWFYRPEETKRGRRSFHGAKELLKSKHTDIQNASSILGKCNVHTLENYTKLTSVGPEDYYWRLEYVPNLEAFVPNQIRVFCVCEMPYNPDILMIECEMCKNWFHPECINLEPGEGSREHLVCSDH